MHRRDFLFGSFHILLRTADTPSRPLHFVVLKSDEHNPRYSAVYGHPFVRTPHMERLARRGTVFENHYTPSPLCRPARSAWMSGRYVHEIQCYSNCTVFSHHHRTYAQVLRAQGVHTVHIGKTDVYRPAHDLGFSEVLHPIDRPPPGDTHISRQPLDIRNDNAIRAEGFGVRPDPFATDDAIIDAAVRWLTEVAPKLQGPWILDVNINAPHFPHYVTQELWDLYPQGADLPPLGPAEASAQHPYAQDLRAHFRTETFTEAQIRGLRRGYLGCVTAADRQLGRLLDAIDATGLHRTTVIAYTSDHGEMLGKFGLWWKSSLYEDAARIPLIVAGPGFSAGTRVQTPTTLLDLQAAMFHALGTRRPHGWKGRSLQLLPPRDTHRTVFLEYHGHGTRASAFALRKGPWKLIYYAAAPHQLFNLEADPEEQNNLANTLPDKKRELERDLRRICDPERENQRAETFIQRELAAIRANYRSEQEPR